MVGGLAGRVGRLAHRGGPLGGISWLRIARVLLLPVGYVYAKLVMAMPDASGEVA